MALETQRTLIGMLTLVSQQKKKKGRLVSALANVLTTVRSQFVDWQLFRVTGLSLA
jgi:hypothetical protein